MPHDEAEVRTGAKGNFENLMIVAQPVMLRAVAASMLVGVNMDSATTRRMSLFLLYGGPRTRTVAGKQNPWKTQGFKTMVG